MNCDPAFRAMLLRDLPALPRAVLGLRTMRSVVLTAVLAGSFKA